jgi:hypothetical protein
MYPKTPPTHTAGTRLQVNKRARTANGSDRDYRGADELPGGCYLPTDLTLHKFAAFKSGIVLLAAYLHALNE